VSVQKVEMIAFFDAIKEFENGQVYSVFTKDQDGNFKEEINSHSDFSFAERVNNHLKKSSFNSLDEKNGRLVYVENQEVLFNEEISTVTYFKDITFGVLYERIKAEN
jgi:hypothetical protein